MVGIASARMQISSGLCSRVVGASSLYVEGACEHCLAGTVAYAQLARASRLIFELLSFELHSTDMHAWWLDHHVHGALRTN